METIQIYMTQDRISADNERMSAESIYDVASQEAAQLVADGYAVKTDFPTLAAVKSGIQSATKQYADSVKRIEGNKLLDPLQIQYKVLEARAELDGKVAELKGKYTTELAALSIVEAQKAFIPAASSEASRGFVDGVLLQLAGGDAKTVIELIRIQLPAMDAATKAEIIRNIPSIKAAAGNHADDFDKLAKSLHAGDSSLKYKMIQRIKATSNPALSYDHLRLTHPTFKDGWAEKEVAEQFAADRR